MQTVKYVSVQYRSALLFSLTRLYPSFEMIVFSCFAGPPIKYMIGVRQAFYCGYRNRLAEMGGMYRIFSVGSYKTVKNFVIA